MKTRNALYKLVVATIVAAGVIGVAIARGRASGANPVSRPICPIPPAECGKDCAKIGMAAVTRGQTARLNAFNFEPHTAVTVELMLLDSQGCVLMHSTQSLMPGQAAFLDLNGIASEVPGLRAEISGEAHFQLDGNATKVGATLEVFDNETGRTSFVLLPAVQKTIWAGR
jgi:hypothetical protein